MHWQFSDKETNRETNSFLRLEKDNEIILGFDSVIDNSEKKATSRFIAGICLNNTDWGNNTLNSYYFINF